MPIRDATTPAGEKAPTPPPIPHRQPDTVLVEFPIDLMNKARLRDPSGNWLRFEAGDPDERGVCEITMISALDPMTDPLLFAQQHTNRTEPMTFRDPLFQQNAAPPLSTPIATMPKIKSADLTEALPKFTDEEKIRLAAGELQVLERTRDQIAANYRAVCKASGSGNEKAQAIKSDLAKTQRRIDRYRANLLHMRERWARSQIVETHTDGWRMSLPNVLHADNGQRQQSPMIPPSQPLTPYGLVWGHIHASCLLQHATTVQMEYNHPAGCSYRINPDKITGPEGSPAP